LQLFHGARKPSKHHLRERSSTKAKHLECISKQIKNDYIRCFRKSTTKVQNRFHRDIEGKGEIEHVDKRSNTKGTAQCQTKQQDKYQNYLLYDEVTQ
jgi:hypothetical protein